MLSTQVNQEELQEGHIYAQNRTEKYLWILPCIYPFFCYFFFFFNWEADDLPLPETYCCTWLSSHFTLPSPPGTCKICCKFYHTLKNSCSSLVQPIHTLASKIRGNTALSYYHPWSFLPFFHSSSLLLNHYQINLLS